MRRPGALLKFGYTQSSVQGAPGEREGLARLHWKAHGAHLHVPREAAFVGLGKAAPSIPAGDADAESRDASTQHRQYEWQQAGSICQF